jgi:hypothetical protein
MGGCENVPILEEIFLYVLTSVPALELELNRMEACVELILPSQGKSLFSTTESMADMLCSVLKYYQSRTQGRNSIILELGPTRIRK